MSEFVFNQLAKADSFLLLMILIVALLFGCHRQYMQLKKMEHQYQISYEKIEQLEQKIKALEENNVNSPTQIMQLGDDANEIANEFWNNKDLLPLFVQFLDGKQRNKLCQINKYFAEIGENKLNQLCLQERSAFRCLNFLELFKIPIDCLYIHKKSIKNENAILKNNKYIDYYKATNEKIFPQNGYILSNIQFTIEILDALSEYMNDANNRVMNDPEKPIRLILNTNEIKIEFEQNDGETVLTLEKRRNSCTMGKFDQTFWENHECENIAIAFDPKENTVVFFNIEQKTIFYNSHFPDVTAILTKPSRIRIDMPPGNYDFYFDEWPKEWKLNYEIFKEFEDL